MKYLFPLLHLDICEENEDTTRMQLAAGQSNVAKGDGVLGGIVDDPLNDLPGKSWPKMHGRCMPSR